jgi:hypothetical protein
MARKAQPVRSHKLAKPLKPRAAAALEAQQVRGGLRTPRIGKVQKAAQDEEN